eukprot:TRINITY_DN5898_c0_g2_i1.p1 TRINITY_DN5898_c0_g2~~TRINITY_DN5898_c0_g2_i1.p1  ORF type:complete len:365 (+),score=140.28 TRINITY_DN5898_c0_g2_i1:105-1199(+)
MAEADPATKRSKVELEDGTAVAQDTANAVELDDKTKAAVVKQIKYYFSDRNLLKDKFMQEKLKDNKEGWIPLSVLLTFNRLKALTTDATAIANAIRTADDCDVEVSEDSASLRRDPAKPLADQAQLDARSIYVKGFEPEKLTIDVVEEWVQSLGATPEAVLLRRIPTNKKLKNSVFVQLATVEEAEQIVAKPQKLGDTDLRVEMKHAYHERKSEERKEKKEALKEKYAEKKKQDRYDAIKATMDKGCVIQLTDLSEDCSREDLKDVFEEFGEIAWVDYSRGESSGYMRYKEAEQASKAHATLTERKTEIKGKVPSLKLLEGQEEMDYWIKVEDERKAVRKAKRDSRHKGKGGYKGKGAKRGKSN